VTVSALCQLHQRCGQDAALAGLRPGGTAPLPAQLLAAITAALEFENERCRKLRGALAVSVEDDDDDEDDEEDDELLECSYGRPGAGKLLSDLVDLEDDIDSDDDDEAGGDTFQELERADPFSKLDVQRYAADYLATIGTATAAAQPELAQRIGAAVVEAKQLIS